MHVSNRMGMSHPVRFSFVKNDTSILVPWHLFQVDYPIINETLQIEDSDEEEDNEKEKVEYIDEENFDFIQKNIDDIIMETLENLKVENRYQMEAEYLKTVEKKVESEWNILVH